jgi:hypothetical protein
VCANPACWIMTKRIHDREFPDYREAKSERMNAAWPRNQFIRRDTARVETDTAALRAAGLPMG